MTDSKTVLIGAAVAFALSNSFFTAIGQTATANHNTVLSPNVRVQLLDALGRVDVSQNLMTVTASSSGGVLVGTVATMVAGTATFTALKFTTCPTTTVMLTFTAGGEGNTAAQGQQLITGAITVSGVTNTYVAFAATGSALVNQGDPLTATANIALPTIIVNLLTSCSSIDTSTSVVVITVTSNGVGLSGTLTAIATNGVATFSNIMFTSAQSNVMLTFTAGSQGSYTVAGQSLISGAITVAASVVPNANLKFFTTGSTFIATGQTATGTHNTPLGVIKVQLYDSSNVVDTTNNAITITATTTSGTLTGNVATVSSGVATFNL